MGSSVFFGFWNEIVCLGLGVFFISFYNLVSVAFVCGMLSYHFNYWVFSGGDFSA
ncbi:hypothetical protein KC19_8G132900 [Ceratodon purpureus]|uniref:Uncharacterized protein n=1 Tax=Ceratodon purpureus TaxID=3225 RepID=A0A8T0H2Z4_CERPU|nr:hypothetical protein KC19_8G132900 [Ceratodon purpureus]